MRCKLTIPISLENGPSFGEKLKLSNPIEIRTFRNFTFDVALFF